MSAVLTPLLEARPASSMISGVEEIPYEYWMIDQSRRHRRSAAARHHPAGSVQCWWQMGGGAPARRNSPRSFGAASLPQ